MEKYKHQHHFNLSKFIHNKYNDLIISNTLRNFALSLISLFLPIYLIELGYKIQTILILEISMLTLSLFLHFLTISILKKIGIKKTLVISYLTTILFYVILYNSEAIIMENGKFVFLAFMGTINVIFTTFFWMAHHLHFIKVTKKKNSGKSYGLLMAIPALLGISSPLIGSILINNHGFKSAFIVATVLMIFSSVALFLSKEINIKHKKINFKNVIKGNGIKTNTMFFVEGVSIIATGFIWPLMLFLTGKKLITLGILYLFSNLIYSYISFYSGKLIDKRGIKNVLLIGTIGHGFSVILRAFSKTMLFITGFQSMGAFFGALWDISFTSNFYKNSHKHPVDSVLNREVYLHLGRISMFLLTILIYLFVGNFVFAFFIALIFSGLFTFTFSLLINGK